MTAGLQLYDGFMIINPSPDQDNIIEKRPCSGIAVPQFFTRGSSNELPLVLWVFYRVKIKLLKFFFQTNSLELF
ncbi:MULTISPECIES: hypothetical protein, partial [unclassified Acinetobacter]|uniref:hypothetical protein n=1 Tax=unclassified Acinetobacter TaxID=196816 RepID=UPI001C550D31